MSSGYRASDRGIISRLLFPLLYAVAGSGVFVLLSFVERGTQILTLVAFGLWGAVLLFGMGILRQTALFALGFSCIINPRKVFGMSEASGMNLSFGEAGFQFLSFTDLVLCVVLFVIAIGQFSDKEKRSGPLLPGWTVFAIVAYLGIAAASCLGAPNLDKALAQVVFDLKLIAMLLIVGYIFSTKGRVAANLPPFFYGVAISALVESVIVVAEYFKLLPFQGNFFGIPFGYAVDEALLGGASVFRVAGTFGHANLLGASMAAMSLLLWEMMVAPRFSLKPQSLFWAAWAGSSIVVIVAYSRGAWFALAVGVACYFPIALVMQGAPWLRRFLKRYAWITLVGCIVLTGLFWPQIERRLFRSDPGAELVRQHLARVTEDVIAKEPYFGGGIGNHFELIKSYSIVKEISGAFNVPMPSHSVYMLVMSEIGIIGAIAFFLIPLSLFIAAVSKSFSHPNDPLSPVCMAFASTFIVFWGCDAYSPVTRVVSNAYFYWMMMGVVVGLRHAIGGDTRAPTANLVSDFIDPDEFAS